MFLYHLLYCHRTEYDSFEIKSGFWWEKFFHLETIQLSNLIYHLEGHIKRGIPCKMYTHIRAYKMIFSDILVSNWSCGVIKHTRVPLSCDTIWSIHPVLDIRTVHIVLCIHHLLLLFNNNTNSLLLRRLLWDWLVASQERWVCTKLPMYVLSTFLLPFHNCCLRHYIIEVDTSWNTRFRVKGCRI